MKAIACKAVRGGTVLHVVKPKYAIYCAWMLTILAVLDVTDRSALPTLQISGLQCSSCGGEDESITEKCLSECLEITDSQMGFLLGPAFSVTSVVATIPIGYLADHYKRVRILLIGMIIWSLATLCSSFCQTFYQLMTFRMILGIGAAVVNPTAFSLLSDYFGPSYRSTVMSFFQSTVYIGQDLGLLCGILSQTTSWRFVFLVLGIPGLVVSLPFYLSVWEPARGGSEQPTNCDSRTSIELEQQVANDSESCEQEAELEEVEATVMEPNVLYDVSAFTVYNVEK